ncbi:MAG: SDR family NAD(P)-dependent oxidoreductase [Alphaproteobacteria bacterium]
MDLGMTGERALIVGASYGIGYESARTLLAEGADAIIVSSNSDKIAAAAERLVGEAGRSVPHLAADVTHSQDVERLAAWVAQRTDRLDILVHAVGGSRRAAFGELDDADWLANYEFNILGTVRVIRAMLPFLRRSEMGRIVILGAAAARMPYAHQVVSNVHKAGLFGLVKTLAGELAPDNIRINSVAPGRTRTPLWIDRADKLARERGVDPEVIFEEFSREIPLGRFGWPEETAAMVAFLASRRASYITGQTVNVDGGIAKGLL